LGARRVPLDLTALFFFAAAFFAAAFFAGFFRLMVLAMTKSPVVRDVFGYRDTALLTPSVTADPIWEAMCASAA
jgi:hypothetical protein